MKPSEKEMIYEINLLRSNPKGYLVYLDQYLKEAKKNPEVIGSGQMKYSLTMFYETINGVEKLVRIDTVWLNEPEDESQAIESLRKDLSSMKPLSILKPDKGIYEAVKKHAMDQDRHDWTLWHVGSDGSMPWDRIKKYSPDMTEGNENIAGRYPEGTARQIVIQLLIDTGIPGYGHRYNLLDPRWTHVACYDAGLKAGLYRWIQNFGQVN
ncbi:MAG: CAP domain-containing protein [Bacteroidales bacterium]|nr:CAP domain-containing protein [Bacteroidales bacterium]